MRAPPPFMLTFAAPYGGVSTTVGLQESRLASEMLTKFRRTKSTTSHRIEVALAVMPATLAFDHHASIIEAKLFIRQTLARYGG